MQNKYYVIFEVITDADGLISISPIKTTEVMPVVPDDDDDDEDE